MLGKEGRKARRLSHTSLERVEQCREGREVFCNE